MLHISETNSQKTLTSFESELKRLCLHSIKLNLELFRYILNCTVMFILPFDFSYCIYIAYINCLHILQVSLGPLKGAKKSRLLLLLLVVFLYCLVSSVPFLNAFYILCKSL